VMKKEVTNIPPPAPATAPRPQASGSNAATDLPMGTLPSNMLDPSLGTTP